jgi:hypothetical protein
MRICFGLLGAYISLMTVVGLARSLAGADVPPEIGSRLVDCGLLLVTLLGGILVSVAAIIAGRAPGLASKAGIGGGLTIVLQAAVTSWFVFAWEPPDTPAMMGARFGELIGTGLWVAIGVAVLVRSVRLRPPASAPGDFVESSGRPT